MGGDVYLHLKNNDKIAKQQVYFAFKKTKFSLVLFFNGGQMWNFVTPSYVNKFLFFP